MDEFDLNPDTCRRENFFNPERNGRTRTGPKFESDFLKTSKDVRSSAKSQNFIDDCVVVRGGGQVCFPPYHTNVCKISRLCDNYIFAFFGRRF